MAVPIRLRQLILVSVIGFLSALVVFALSAFSSIPQQTLRTGGTFPQVARVIITLYPSGTYPPKSTIDCGQSVKLQSPDGQLIVSIKEICNVHGRPDAYAFPFTLPEGYSAKCKTESVINVRCLIKGPSKMYTLRIVFGSDPSPTQHTVSLQQS